MTFHIRLENKYFSFPIFIVISILSLSTFQFIIDLCLGKSFEEHKVKTFPSKNSNFQTIKIEYILSANWDFKLHYIQYFSFKKEKHAFIFPLLCGWGLNENRELVHCFVNTFFRDDLWLPISGYIYFITDAAYRQKI